MEEKLTVKEVEKIYQIPEQTQYAMRKSRRITYAKERGRIFYTHEWVKKALEPQIVRAEKR